MLSLRQFGFIVGRWMLASVLWMLTSAALATPIEVNTATGPELESIKGIGPRMAANITTERHSANFRDWTDLIERVQGIGAGSALKFSNHGLTVNGTPYSASSASASASASTPTSITSSASRKSNHSTIHSGRGVIMTIHQPAATPNQPAPRSPSTPLKKAPPRPANIGQAP